jgi:PAS domain-containing protein
MFSFSPKEFLEFSNKAFAFYGTITKKGQLTSIEGNFYNSFGLSKHLFIGKDLIEAVIWQTETNNPEKLKAAFESALNDENSKVFLNFKTETNDTKFIELNFFPNIGSKPDSIFFCANDVSEIQSEINTYKSRCDFFLYAVDFAEIGFWTWNIKTDEIYSNPKCKELFGLNEETEPTFNHLTSILHPDDYEEVVEKLNESKKKQRRISITIPGCLSRWNH